jgi:hypothetical protein
VTSVGKAATQTTLAASTIVGDQSSCRRWPMSAPATRDHRHRAAHGRAVVASVGIAGSEGSGVTLKRRSRCHAHREASMSGPGTGISFTPATRVAHRSGDAVQALGSGVSLDRPLARAHACGAPVRYQARLVRATRVRRRKLVRQRAVHHRRRHRVDRSIRLVVMDAIVHGSRRVIPARMAISPRPDLATLEGVQHQGGCMAIVPGAGSGPNTANIAAAAAAPGAPNRSIGRFPDGHDTDSLCTDFVAQPVTTLPEGAAAGATNIKVAGVAEFAAGQTVMIGSGPDSETAVIASVGTAGSTRAGAATQVGDTFIPVAATAGFVVGQSIAIDSGATRKRPPSRWCREAAAAPHHRNGAAHDCPSIRHAAGRERHHAHAALARRIPVAR